MDKMLKAMFDELRMDLRKELCEDITKLLASKRRRERGGAKSGAAAAVQATPPTGPANAEVNMDDMLCQRYDAFSKEIRQMLRAKYIPKQAGLLSKDQKVMIMKQCILPAPALTSGGSGDAANAQDVSDHTRTKVDPAPVERKVEVIPLTESDDTGSDDESADEEGAEEEGEGQAKEKTPPLTSDGFYLQCSQMPVQPPPPIESESAGWRKRRMPTSSTKAPPSTPCSKRAAEPVTEKEQTDEPPAKKQASSSSHFIKLDWDKVFNK